EFDVRAGMILIATGFEHYEPAPGEYGYGIFPEVVTLPQLIRVLDSIPEGDRKLVWKGREINSIAMIHCVGSRHIEGVHQPKDGGKLNQYCSRVCCTAALQAGRELTGRFSGLNIFDFYRDIRTYGRGHEDYYEDAVGTLFFRFVPENPPLVERNNDGEHPLIVKVNDQLTYNTEIEVPVDMVVLSVGMEPQDTRNIVEMVKLPVGLDGFFQEVHPKLRPVESSVGGVLLAGTCQGPKDITESCNAASAAAVKLPCLVTISSLIRMLQLWMWRNAPGVVSACPNAPTVIRLP
ncbi:MAG: CoB--CoM heterodisulfide reductase iron-sulfur subunit A family protein, partial [Chloroflexi bacterium]|nr:CoB--CoM heterodisulfide reductase iron-sulfur subunit A family protein [Chloroflexota bacterium]